MCPPFFTLSKVNTSKIGGLLYELHLKPNMLIELCTINFCIVDGLVDNVEGFFKIAMKSNLTSKFWIEFLNSRIGQHTRIINKIHYEKFPTIQNNWTPIIAKIQEVQVSHNSNHLFTCIQFPIQLAIVKTIRHAQILSMDNLAFDPHGVSRHNLTYTTLFTICTNINLNFFKFTPTKKIQH
jgi:hypothetical protein